MMIMIIIKKGVKNKLFVAHIGTRPQSYDLSPCLM